MARRLSLRSTHRYLPLHLSQTSAHRTVVLLPRSRPHLPSPPSSLTSTRPLHCHASLRASASTITPTPAAATVAIPAAPIKKPVGAFRGGVFGFLLGSTLAGAATWFYIMEEYRVSNELLTEDIYALQAAVQRIHTLVLGLEERLVLAEMKSSKK